MNTNEIKDKTIQMRNGKIKMLRDGECWTENDREVLRREYSNGTSLNEIAIMLQRSEGAIYQQVERLGLYSRNPFSTRKKNEKADAYSCLCKNCKCDRALCPRCKVYQAVLEDV